MGRAVAADGTIYVADAGHARVLAFDGEGTLTASYGDEGELENLATLDTYGHGTHMAGIIAGNDGTADGFKGMAPDARIVSVKVAGATGETHVAQVVAAIDWVVEHRNRDGLNIRVLNLSLGQAGVDSSSNDVLSASVERAKAVSNAQPVSWPGSQGGSTWPKAHSSSLEPTPSAHSEEPLTW